MIQFVIRLVSAMSLGLVVLMPLVILTGCSNDDPMSMGQDNQVAVLISPADGAVNVATSTTFAVTFNRAMNHGQAEGAFLIHRGWGIGGMTRIGTFTWNQESTIMTFHPAMPLDSNATFTVHMMGMMRGMDGMDYHPMLDSMRMGGGMMSGRMMGGMDDDEIRIVCSTGPDIRRQIDFDLTDDAVFVADGGSGDIAVIDPVTNTLIGIQPIENVRFLHHLGLSPDRTRLVVADPGENLASGGGGGHGGHGGGMGNQSRIVVLDSRTLREVGRLNIEGVAHNAAVTPDGASLIYANASSNNLHRFSFPGLTPVESWAVGVSPLEASITPDGVYALTANSGDGTVTRLRLMTPVRLMTPAGSDVIQVGQRPIGAWISPDGTVAWVTNEESKSVTRLRINPLGVDTSITLGFTPGQAVVNPTRSEVYLADEDGGQVVIFDSETSARLGAIATGAGAHGITFNPDGSKAFITNEHAMSVTVIDTRNRTILATILVGMRPNGILYRRGL